jgi:hypothetical protein
MVIGSPVLYGIRIVGDFVGDRKRLEACFANSLVIRTWIVTLVRRPSPLAIHTMRTRYVATR